MCVILYCVTMLSSIRHEILCSLIGFPGEIISEIDGSFEINIKIDSFSLSERVCILYHTDLKIWIKIVVPLHLGAYKQNHSTWMLLFKS